MPIQIDFHVHDCPVARIDPWVRAEIGPVENVIELSGCRFYEFPGGTVLLLGPMIGEERSWVNISFDGLWPWETTLDCALRAARELGCVVSCDLKGRWVEVCPQQDGRAHIVTLLSEQAYTGPLVEIV
jgi:hypothetical protein